MHYDLCVWSYACQFCLTFYHLSCGNTPSLLRSRLKKARPCCRTLHASVGSRDALLLDFSVTHLENFCRDVVQAGHGILMSWIFQQNFIWVGWNGQTGQTHTELRLRSWGDVNLRDWCNYLRSLSAAGGLLSPDNYIISPEELVTGERFRMNAGIIVSAVVI